MIVRALTTLLAMAAFSLAASGESLPVRLEDALRKVDDDVIAWRRDIHRHPELSNREFRTSKLVAAHLRSLGLEVRTGVAHTGVTAVLRGGQPGPVIALRADMDALPVTELVDLPFKSTVTAEYHGKRVGVMHACGHDAHVAILMGVAEALASIRAELPGSVLFVFQPAEEGAPEGEQGGAALMLREGALAKPAPEAMFGLHVGSGMPTGAIGYRSGPFMAGSDSFRIVVTGRQAHGSQPWAGVDPIVAAAQIVMGLQTIVSRQIDITKLPAVVTVGAIDGGVRHNIIPDAVEMSGTIRTFDAGMRADIIERMKQTTTQIAAAGGAKATLMLSAASTPVVVNDPRLAERVLPSLQRVAGAQHVSTTSLMTTAEDFAFYAQRIPSFFFFLGVTPPEADPAQAASNHSPLFYVDEAALAVGSSALAAIVVDYLQGA